MTAMHALVAAMILTAIPVSANAQPPIEEGEVEKWIAKQNDCGDDLDQIHIIKLDEVDFTHDGRPQAIVVAMSCETGTAGPDVHAVVARNSKEELVELPFPRVDPKILDEVLFGPGNATLDVDHDLLVVTHTDSTGRENPLVVKYKWNGKQFEIAAIEKSKPFLTSYDCAKADEDTDRAICYVKSLADLDLQLDAVYKKVLHGLPVPKRNALRTEQRKWLAARNAGCPINDKRFVDCLEDHYRKRLAELTRRLSATKVPQ